MAVKLVKKQENATPNQGAAISSQKIKLVSKGAGNQQVPRSYSTEPKTQTDRRSDPNRDSAVSQSYAARDTDYQRRMSQLQEQRRQAQVDLDTDAVNRLDREMRELRASVNRLFSERMSQLQEQRRQAQVDLDTDAVNRLDRELKELRASVGQQTVGDRWDDVLSGSFNTGWGQSANAVGTLATGVDHNERQIARLQEALETGYTSDGKPINDAQRKGIEESIARMLAENAAVQNDPNHAGNRLQQTADIMTGTGEKQIESAKKGLGSPGQFLVDVGVGGLQLAGDVAASALVPGAGTALMATRAFGGSAQEARHAGATREQQLLYGAGSAAASLLTEKLSNVGGAFKTAFGAGILDKALAKVTAKPFGKLIAAAISEGGEEFIEALAQPLLQKLTYNPDAAYDEEWLSEALYSAAVGAVLGSAGTAISPSTYIAEAAGMNPATETGVGAKEQTFEGKFTPQTENAAEGFKTPFAEERKPGAVNPEQKAAQAAYEAGKANLPRERADIASEAQEEAYMAGQRDRIANTSDADLAIENQHASEYTGTNETEVVSDEEVHLRDSSQWVGSENPSGQVSAMEGGAGRNQSGQAQSKSADSGAASLSYGEAVSTSSLGIKGGSQTANVRLVTGGETVATKAAKKLAKDRGLRLVLFTGNNLEIEQADGSMASVRAYISGDRVFVRVDHPLYAADQLMRHEAGHDMIAKGEVNLDEVRSRIEAKHGKEKVGQFAQMYVDAYEGTGMTPSEIWEEVVCDSLGDMNIFAETEVEQVAHELLAETKNAAADTEATQTRGPPVEGKTSREVDLEYQSNFSGHVFSDRGVKLSSREKAAISSAIKSGNAHMNESGNMGSVNVGDKCYLFEPFSDGDAYIRDVVDADELNIHKHKYSQGGKYGKRKGNRRVGGNPDKSRSGLPHGSEHLSGSQKSDAENDRMAGSKSGGDSSGDDAESLGSEQDSLTYSPDYAYWRNAVKGKASRELPKPDAEYLSAVERGDMEAAQKMVDEAAKEAGYTVKAYHGTDADPFNVFDKERIGQSSGVSILGDGFYFAEKSTTAEQYGRNVHAVYIKQNNPYMATVDDAYNLNAAALERNGFDGVVLPAGKGKIYMVFDPEQIKSAGPVTYDDNGNVIPLSERFNEKNKDIRFSRELDSVNALREQNEALQEKVEYWKNQTKRTVKPTLRQDDVDKLAKKIVKNYDGEIDATEISGELKELGEYIVRAGEEFSWTEVKDRAMNIARKVVNSASVLVNGEAMEDYSGIKSYLKKQKLAFDDKGDIADYNDFRKRNFGRFTISKDGLPIDVAWSELQETFGESYFPSNIIHPADQLQHIADLFDNMDAIFENPFSYHMAEATEYVANDIVDRLFSDDLRLTPPTFADRQAEKLDKARQDGRKAAADARLAGQMAQGRKMAAEMRKAEERSQAKQEALAEKLDKQKAKDRERLDVLRQQKNGRIAEIREQGRERAKAAVNAVRADRDAKIAELKERYKEKGKKASENRKARDLRGKIQRHAKDLSAKLLRPSDKQHIPEALRGAVANLLDAINLESNYELEYGADAKYHRVKPGESRFAEATKRTKAFAALKAQYTKLAEELSVDPDLMGDDGLLSDVIAMADKRMADMSAAELEVVWQTMRAVEASISSANKAFTKARWETIAEAAEELRKDNAGKSLRTEYNGPLGKLQQLTGLDMMTPESYLHRLGKAGDAMFRMMRDAQDKHIRMMKAVSDFTHDKLGKVNVNKLEKTMHTVKLGGEDVKLSTAQLMELYVLMRRQQAQEHIMLGGILPDVVSKGSKKIARAEPVRGVTPEEISSAVSLLSAEEVQVAEALQEFASTQLSEWGNEASMQVYNYKKFNEKNYWPIRSNKQETQSNVQKDTAVTSVANRGFTKATKPHANTSVRLGSIFDTFSTHSSEMATYAAWLGASEDINRIRNYTFKNSKGERTGTVKGIIERVHGTQGTQYLQKLLADIANGVKGTHSETQFMSGLVGNYKAASVGANLRVIIQQPTAILRAMDMLDPQYLVAGMRPENGWKKALKYAPIAQWKDWGYFDINTGRQMKDVLFDSDTLLDKAKNISMAGAGFADSVSWGMLWNAVETETKVKRKDLKPGTNEFYEAVAKRFTEIVDHTQVVDGILQRSQIMRSADGLTKMATSFMGEPTKQYNMLVSAAYDAKNIKGEGRKAAKQRLARAAMTLAVSGVVNAMAQSVMDAVRDDDKEKDYWDKWLRQFFGFTGDEEGVKEHWDAFWAGNLGNTVNPAGYIPYVKDALSILQGYDVSRMDMESVEKTFTAAQNMIKALNKEGKYTLAGASANLFAEAARLIGIPVANLKREVRTFAMLAAIETDNYLMQYRMEKMSLELNYSGNSSTFMDILYNAYVNDQEAYKLIYADMVKGGFDTEKIQSGMESRMKKAQGVKSVDDLEQRYLSPSVQKEYDKTLKTIQHSPVWGRATGGQRDALEDNLYTLLSDTDSGKKMKEKVDEGAAYGISDADYLLYKMALEIADKPNENGKLKTYTNDEVEAAIEMLGLSDKESSYLWLAQGKSEKSNPWG